MKIKKCFTSRWGDKGYIVNADYKQIEVVVLAYLSRDLSLMSDVRKGIDFHSKRLAFARGENYKDVVAKVKAQDPYYTAARTDIKSFTFQFNYGAGANAISKGTGIHIDTVKEFIVNEDRLYPGVKVMQDGWIETVERSRELTMYRSKTGRPVGMGTLPSLTGRKYTFLEGDAPDWMKGKSVTFKPTEIKNYAVQGSAGELMRIGYGQMQEELFKDLELYEYCKAINTVHDSCIFDVHEDYLERALVLIKSVLESVPQYYEEYFGIKFDLPLRVDIDYARSWGG